MKKTFLLLLGIILVAIALRFWQLGNIPPSPDWDEVALGYNAYSIMQTGKDEYGKSFPVVLRSFDDYKPALYVYFVIPFIKLFDLTILAVRLPSAIFGILTVLGVFFLTKEIFKKNDIALLSSFLLVISPWHIQFSRIAFESNVGLAFNVFSVLFFLKGLKKPWFLFLSAFLAGINIYVYQSEKVFTPILFLTLIIIFKKELFSISKKYLISAVIIGILVLLPMINYILTNKNVFERAQGVSIFSESTQLLKENSKKLLVDRQNNDILGLVLDNRRLVFTKEILSGYISHFGLNWLFITGDIERHHAPHMGLLYLFELPFLFIGMYKLIFSSFADGFGKKTKLLIFSWFLIAPIPASITSGVPHAVRTLNFLPTFQIFTAIGALVLASFISNIKYQISKIQIKYLIFSLCFLFFIFNFVYYFDQYFVQQNYLYSKNWQYGYKEAIDIVRKIENKYKKIIVSNQPHMDQSYMFFLFYLKYPPKLYQKESKFTSGGFRENHKFGKFEFRPFNFSNEKDTEVLFVGRIFDFPQNDFGLVKIINFLDGTPAIKIAERK